MVVGGLLSMVWLCLVSLLRLLCILRVLPSWTSRSPRASRAWWSRRTPRTFLGASKWQCRAFHSRESGWQFQQRFRIDRKSVCVRNRNGPATNGGQPFWHKHRKPIQSHFHEHCGWRQQGDSVARRQRRHEILGTCGGRANDNREGRAKRRSNSTGNRAYRGQPSRSRRGRSAAIIHDDAQLCFGESFSSVFCRFATHCDGDLRGQTEYACRVSGPRTGSAKHLCESQLRRKCSCCQKLLSAFFGGELLGS